MDAKEAIEKGFADLEVQRKKDREERETAEKKTGEELAALHAKQKSTDEWVSKVEAQVNTARTHGPGDGLLAAIPDQLRKHIEYAERAGVAEPVKKVALGAWWQAAIMSKAAVMRGESAERWIKQREAIEKGWGYDPALAISARGAQGEVIGGGANIIATPVEAELYRLIRDNTVIRPLATRIVMTSLTHQLPTENANITAYLVAEAATITDSVATTGFSQIALTAKKFAGLATVSNELLEDNIIGLQEYVFTAIAESIGIIEDQGAADGTNFTGIGVATSVNSFSATGNTSGGDVPTYPNMVKLIFLAIQKTSRQNAYFIMHPTAFRAVAGITDTNGQPVLQFNNVPNAIQERVLGYPVAISSALTLANAIKTSSTSIYFGPPTKIIFGDLTGMEFMLDPYGRMTTYETRIRVVKRTGIVVPVGTYFSIMRGVINA